MDLNLLKTLTQPIFYLTNDVSRGLGLEGLLPNYHIICLDDQPLIDTLIASGVSVFCLERTLGEKNSLYRSAGKILEHPLSLEFIRSKSAGARPQIMFFKPQKKIELIAEEQDFGLIGNATDLNRQFEDKLNFFKLSQELGIPLPEGEIVGLQDCFYQDLVHKYGPVLVIQFGRGWAGNSTFFVNSQEELETLKRAQGAIKVKASRFIKGITVLNNAAIYHNQVLFSPPALQLRASPEISSHLGATAGRQWPVSLNSAQQEAVARITDQVGRAMAKRGYRGFFGLDFLVEEGSGQVYLSENNARLTASTSFYTQLELQGGIFPLLGYHLLAFLGEGREEVDYCFKAQGSEIVGRNTSSLPVQIKESPQTGLYSKGFSFKKPSCSLAGALRGDFWLEAAAPGRVVNPEIELFRINTLELVAGSDGQIKEEYRAIIKRIKEAIEFADVKVEAEN